MNSFAYIVSPLTIKQLKDNLNPLMQLLPDFIVSNLHKKLTPFESYHIERIHCVNGNEAAGHILCAPLLNEFPHDNFVLEKIVEAGFIAEKLGVKVIGISGYASKIADKKFNSLAKRIRLPTTTGNTYSAWVLFEQVYRTSKAKNLDLKKATIAVLGAGSTVGYLCARKLADYGSKIIINDINKTRLDSLKEVILHLHSIEVIIEDDRYEAIKDADIVINTSEIALNVAALKPKAIFCELTPLVSVRSKHKEITFIEGGLVKMPYREYGNGIIPATLAETMLLALDEKFVSYSLGENINLDSLEEIADIAVRHEFEVWVPHGPVL